MKTIKERKNQYVVTGLHCLINHLIIFAVLCYIDYSGIEYYSQQDYDPLSYSGRVRLPAFLFLRWVILFSFITISISCWKYYFPTRKQLIVFDENGVRITDPWVFPWLFRRDEIYFFRWAQIKYIMFDVVYDTIEIKPTYGKTIRISYLHFLFSVNFYHMAKAIKEYSGDDDIVIATKPLWHCYLIHGNSKEKEPKKRKKHTPPRQSRHNHY